MIRFFLVNLLMLSTVFALNSNDYAGVIDATCNADEEKVYASECGILGEGDDTTILQYAYALAIQEGLTLDLEGETYIVRPYQFKTVYAPTYYVFETQSNTKIVGNGATIKLGDNVSTNENPKQIAIFLSTSPNPQDTDDSTFTENFDINGVTFDMNVDNNLIGESNKNKQFKTSALMWGKSAIKNLKVDNCHFKNSAGNVSILVSWSYKEFKYMSNNVTIQNSTFQNTAKHVHDESVINLHANHALITNCVFKDPNKNATAIETHGSNVDFIGNRIVNGYARGVIISANTFEDINNVVIQHNHIDVTRAGVHFYSNEIQSRFGTIKILKNNIYLRGGGDGNGQFRVGVNCNAATNGFDKIHIRHNLIRTVYKNDLKLIGVLFNNKNFQEKYNGKPVVSRVLDVSQNDFKYLHFGLLSSQKIPHNPGTEIHFNNNEFFELTSIEQIGVSIGYNVHSEFLIPKVNIIKNTFLKKGRAIDFNRHNAYKTNIRDNKYK